MTIYVNWEDKKILTTTERAEWIAKKADEMFWDDDNREAALDNYLAFFWRMNFKTIESLSDETRTVFAEQPSFEDWIDEAATCCFEDEFEEIEIEA